MKKLAIGCGIVLLLVGIGAGIAGYMVYRTAKSYLAQFQQIAALDKNVTNQSPFTPPATGELSEEHVVRFAVVQERMHNSLGKRIDEMTARQNEFQRRQESERRDASPGEVVAVVRDMMGLILEAKNAQVEALNQARFSLDEYYWVRERVYAAAGMTITELSLRNLPEAMREGNLTQQVRNSDPVPPRNAQLVAPYLPKMKEWAPLAFFGL